MTNGITIPPEAFAELVRQHLDEQGMTMLDHDGMQMTVYADAGEVELDLTRFYEAYRQNPSELDTVIRILDRILRGEIPLRTERDYAELADRIFPMLKPIELLLEVRERKLPMLVYRDFPGGLIITYVIDEPRSVAYINEPQLERWGISAIDLHEHAIENLRRRTATQVQALNTGEDDRRLYIFNSGDGYDATRLLLNDVLGRWQTTLPGNMVIGVPNRDFLIAFSDSNQEIFTAVAHQIQADAARLDHGLTDQLFTLEQGAIREYHWE